MNRQKAYQQNQRAAQVADFWAQHEKQLERLHRKYQRETGGKMPLVAFVDYIYQNAPDLVLNPQNN